MSGFITFVFILFNLIVGNKIITYICDDMIWALEQVLQ